MRPAVTLLHGGHSAISTVTLVANAHAVMLAAMENTPADLQFTMVKASFVSIPARQSHLATAGLGLLRRTPDLTLKFPFDDDREYKTRILRVSSNHSGSFGWSALSTLDKAQHGKADYIDAHRPIHCESGVFHTLHHMCVVVDRGNPTKARLICRRSTCQSMNQIHECH